jgi:FtsH-binding integral membrane protein
MTAGIVIALTMYAFFTKTDFTVCGGTLFVIGASLLFFGLFCFLFGEVLRMIYCVCGVILFGIYLIVDT